jgi:chromosomal replication initiator protein
VTQDSEHIWSAIQIELRQAVPPDMYDIWLAPLRLVEVDGATVLVEAPGELRAWVAERFERVLQTSAAAVLGPHATVDVRSGATSRPGPRGAGRRPLRDQLPDHDRHDGESEPIDALNPSLTFERFVIGDSNRLAHAAALAVAELPGQAYNPLFIYGPPGVGKTHLLHSIGNYVRAFGGGLTVRYTTVETFTNEFVAALHGGDIDRFKGRYRHSDVLLIDDVQFLASKVKTEEEFFHTFNALHDMGSQLVLTSDRLPRGLAGVEDRLRERFEAGLVTAIAPPDLPTRFAVLRKLVDQNPFGAVPGDVLEFLAERAPNMRALHGALNRVVAYASLERRPLSADLVAEKLGDLGDGPATGDHPAGTRAPSTIEGIQELVANAFAITTDDLLSASRAARVAWPRQVAMYLAREHTGHSLPEIGRAFGGRNHTTVLHACRRTVRRLQDDPDAADVVRSLTDRLAAPPANPGSLRHD